MSSFLVCAHGRINLAFSLVDFFQIKQSEDFRRELSFANCFILTLAFLHCALYLVQQEAVFALLRSAMSSYTSSTYAVNGSVTEYVSSRLWHLESSFNPPLMLLKHC
jgi:hypothetical protein